MAYEHLGIHNTELAEIIVTYDTATRAAEEITAHFRQQQAAHEEASQPKADPVKIDKAVVSDLIEKVFEVQPSDGQLYNLCRALESHINNPGHHVETDYLGVPWNFLAKTPDPVETVRQVQAVCREIVGLPLPVSASELENILAAAAGDLALAAEMVNTRRDCGPVATIDRVDRYRLKNPIQIYETPGGYEALCICGEWIHFRNPVHDDLSGAIKYFKGCAGTDIEEYRNADPEMLAPQAQKLRESLLAEVEEVQL